MKFCLTCATQARQSKSVKCLTFQCRGQSLPGQERETDGGLRLCGRWVEAIHTESLWPSVESQQVEEHAASQLAPLSLRPGSPFVLSSGFKLMTFSLKGFYQHQWAHLCGRSLKPSLTLGCCPASHPQKGNKREQQALTWCLLPD